ncbi:hypothetical protein C453_01490 [Haloferax elongans ATCC BAA-1513]|uniref:Uncharacterized protein n=1 Tax=Haloferax elongans ATCC BAA-1513 TaxID=1230453 RepID=M0HVK6_HALEO|nr:hypothetical protein [Haloferax elongans]ELZ88496.1 hypothetical protein C453_01490 [Haloferax elongans ATCC BAA-1513]
MGKTTEEALLDAIAPDFHTYLRKGVRLDRVIDSAHSELNVDDIETLLRIHFVLTDAEDDGGTVGVLDFMRQLESRIRRMKTTTSPRSFEHRGEIRGQIDWQGTVKTRARAGRLEEPVFVCTQPEEHYNIDENLVLKRLLTVIHDIVTNDLAYALENPAGYDWLDGWVTSDAGGDGNGGESAAEMLDRVYEQNIYLQRVNVADAEITDRTIESVKRSRSRFYQDAAVLLDRYRQLMNYELDSVEARDILDHTLIAPDKTDTLFELYWVFRVLAAYEDVEYRVLTDARDSPSTIATWEQDGSRFVLSHDATGDSLTFNESAGSDAIEPDGYLYRMNEVLSRWQSLSQEFLGRGGSDSLWGGRPDIVLERYDTSDVGEWELAQVFVGEVKYTQNIDYVATGLRELLEYMAFVKDATTKEYVETVDDLLESVAVKGLLFVDDLGREIGGVDNEGVEILQYPESPDSVL